MASRRRQSSVKVGQNTLFDGIEGLDKLVNRPEVLDRDGLKVVTLLVKQEDVDVPGYVDMALSIARQFAPEVKSKERPPWLRQDWLAKKRKKKAGVL